MSEYRSLLERAHSRFPAPELPLEDVLQGRDRRRRNQRIAAGVVGMAVFVGAVWVVTSVAVGTRDGGQQPAMSGATAPVVTPPATTEPWVSPPVTVAPWVTPSATSEVDLLIDVNTGETTPLPGAILQLGENLTRRVGDGRYAASPDGSTLAVTGLGEEGVPQIFIANLGGTDVRQVTHDPIGATSPAWSPDGSLIAYVASSRAGNGSLFVFDVATGKSTRIGDAIGYGPSFTPDGSSLLYVASGPEYPLELRTVPVAGGESRPLFGADAGIDDAGNASISPDGSLVTFLGSGTPPTREFSHCGPCRFMANVDGTNRQVIGGWMANPAGIWSPDGSRIVAMEILGGFDLKGPGFELEQPELKRLGRFFTEVIVVVDVATEVPTIVAYGRSAIWVDDHTILVEV